MALTDAKYVPVAFLVMHKPIQSRVQSAAVISRVAVPHVASFHYLIEHESTILFIRITQQISLLHSENLLQHPHQCRGIAFHIQTIHPHHGINAFLLRKSLFQNKVIVQQLTQTAPMFYQMMKTMQHNVFPIESHRRHIIVHLRSMHLTELLERSVLERTMNGSR